MNAATDCVVFRSEELLPESWQRIAGRDPVRAFNPGLIRQGEGWLFAYRVVLADGLRRIAICRLDTHLQVVPGSAAAVTDGVKFRSRNDYPEIVTSWFADPRLYWFGQRLFIYWNSGWHEPRNYQFLQEIDPRTLAPIGFPRELVLQGERQKLEKNWTFFVDPASERFWALYSISPQRILEFSLGGSGDIAFAEASRAEWSSPSYPPSHGGLRGGAPPVLHDGRYWVFCHSVHDGPNGYHYAAAAYCYDAARPFRPVACPARPLSLGNPFGERRVHGRLNPAVAEVIYPCGAAWDGTRWLVSHGINDEHCAISRVTPAAVVASLEPITPA